MTATKIQPGDDLHLTSLMAPHSLNFVTGADRAALLAYGRDVFAAGLAGAAPAAVAPRARDLLGIVRTAQAEAHRLINGEDSGSDLAQTKLDLPETLRVLEHALSQPAAVAGPANDLAELAMLNKLVELGTQAYGALAESNSDDGPAGTAAYVRWQERRAEMGELIRAHKAPALEAPAAPAVPAGFALVPMRLTRAMGEVLEEEGWQWEDLLAAAGAITESDHTAISRGEPSDGEIQESFAAYGAELTDKHLEAVREIVGNALAAAPQAPNCTRCSGSGEDPEGYLTHGRGPDDHTVDGPCRECDGTGAAPQAPAAPMGVVGWVKDECTGPGAFDPMFVRGAAPLPAGYVANYRPVVYAAAPAAPAVDAEPLFAPGAVIGDVVRDTELIVQNDARYRLLRRGQHWSVIDGKGDVLRGDELDSTIDARLAAQAAAKGE